MKDFVLMCLVILGRYLMLRGLFFLCFCLFSVPVDPGDESTTNIYVGNINPKVSCFFDVLSFIVTFMPSLHMDTFWLVCCYSGNFVMTMLPLPTELIFASVCYLGVSQVGVLLPVLQILG